MGKLLGIETTHLLTLTSEPRPDGTSSVEGSGILTSKDGEVVTAEHTGVSWTDKDGRHIRGAQLLLDNFEEI